MPTLICIVLGDLCEFAIQRFSEVTDHLGMAILSIIPGNPLLSAF